MSKGGDSSDSATTQTPAQWAAALSNTSIAAWKEADILAISLDKLQALSATQISQITVPWALPGAVWTADTLNAVPLQYWGTFGPRYLSTTSNGVTTVTPFSQLSAVASGSASGYSNWFADLGYSYQSNTNKWTFSPSVVAGISTERIARIGSGLGTASQAPALNINNGVVDTSAFEGAVSSATNKGESMKTWSFPISAAESVAGISKRSVVMFGAGWSDMGADFMGALTASQLGAIAHAEDVLGATQLGYLSANQLIALRQMDWSWVSAAQLNGITLEAFSGLQSNIITAISEAAWRGLDKAHTQKLNAGNIRLLSASKIGALQYLGYALTASVGAILTANQVASIQSGCWAQVSDTSFLNALPLSVMQSIAPSAFASMSTAVIAGMDGLHLGALTDAQALVFPLSALNDASVAFYRNPNTLNFNDFVNNQTVNWAKAPASFIKLLTLEQLKLLHPNQIAQLSLAAIAGLTRSQTQALMLEQIQALSTAQLSAAAYISRRIDVVSQIFGVFTVTRMGTAFWSRVDSSFLNALSLSAFAAITSAQVAAISSDAFAGLDKAHFDAFTITQLLALTAQQVGAFRGEYLTIHFLRNVRLDSFKGLVPEQMRRLHDYLFNTVATNAFADGDPVLLATAEHQFASLLATIMDSDDGREAWLQQSVNLLIRLQWLDPVAAATLSASDVQNTYAALNWSWMSGTFLNNTMTSVFAQIKASSIAQLNLSAVAALNDAHIQALTVTQAAALSGEQLSAITHLGALQASVVRSLSASQLAGITQDWSQISATFLNNMEPWQFAALTPEQFGQLTYTQLSNNNIAWSLLTAADWNALSLDNFQQLCEGESPPILQASSAALLGLSNQQMTVLAQASRFYNGNQRRLLLTGLFGSFDNDQSQNLLGMMRLDDIDQIVLQVALVNLMAKMDGTTAGINTAISALAVFRQTQPAFLGADNLALMVTALNQQEILISERQDVINHVFQNDIWSRANAIGAILKFKNLLMTEQLSQVNRLTQSVKQSFRNPAVIDVADLVRGATTQGALIGVVDEMFRGLARNLVLDAEATTRLEQIKTSVNNSIRRDTEAQLNSTRQRQPALVELSQLSNQQLRDYVIAKVNRSADSWFEEQYQRIVPAGVVREAVSSAATASLAFASLVVLIGASISAFGTAAYAAVDSHLTAKERQNLVATSVLGGLAYVAQGLQLPITLIIQAIVEKATGQRYVDSPSYLSAVWQKFTEGFVTLRNAGAAEAIRDRVVNAQDLPDGNNVRFFIEDAISPKPVLLSYQAADGGFAHLLANNKLNINKSAIATFDDEGAFVGLTDLAGNRLETTAETAGTLEGIVEVAKQKGKSIRRILVSLDSGSAGLGDNSINRKLDTIANSAETPLAENIQLVKDNVQRFIYRAVENGLIEPHLATSEMLVAARQLLIAKGVAITPSVSSEVTNIVLTIQSNQQPSFEVEASVLNILKTGGASNESLIGAVSVLDDPDVIFRTLRATGYQGTAVEATQILTTINDGYVLKTLTDKFQQGGYDTLIRETGAGDALSFKNALQADLRAMGVRTLDTPDVRFTDLVRKLQASALIESNVRSLYNDARVLGLQDHPLIEQEIARRISNQYVESIQRSGARPSAVLVYAMVRDAFSTTAPSVRSDKAFSVSLVRTILDSIPFNAATARPEQLLRSLIGIAGLPAKSLAVKNAIKAAFAQHDVVLVEGTHHIDRAVSFSDDVLLSALFSKYQAVLPDDYPATMTFEEFSRGLPDSVFGSNGSLDVARGYLSDMVLPNSQYSGADFLHSEVGVPIESIFTPPLEGQAPGILKPLVAKTIQTILQSQLSRVINQAIIEAHTDGVQNFMESALNDAVATGSTERIIRAWGEFSQSLPLKLSTHINEWSQNFDLVALDPDTKAFVEATDGTGLNIEGARADAIEGVRYPYVQQALQALANDGVVPAGEKLIRSNAIIRALGGDPTDYGQLLRTTLPDPTDAPLVLAVEPVDAGALQIRPLNETIEVNAVAREVLLPKEDPIGDLLFNGVKNEVVGILQERGARAGTFEREEYTLANGIKSRALIRQFPRSGYVVDSPQDIQAKFDWLVETTKPSLENIQAKVKAAIAARAGSNVSAQQLTNEFVVTPLNLENQLVKTLDEIILNTPEDEGISANFKAIYQEKGGARALLSADTLQTLRDTAQNGFTQGLESVDVQQMLSELNAPVNNVADAFKTPPVQQVLDTHVRVSGETTAPVMALRAVVVVEDSRTIGLKLVRRLFNVYKLGIHSEALPYEGFQQFLQSPENQARIAAEVRTWAREYGIAANPLTGKTNVAFEVLRTSVASVIETSFASAPKLNISARNALQTLPDLIVGVTQKAGVLPAIKQPDLIQGKANNDKFLRAFVDHVSSKNQPTSATQLAIQIRDSLGLNASRRNALEIELIQFLTEYASQEGLESGVAGDRPNYQFRLLSDDIVGAIASKMGISAEAVKQQLADGGIMPDILERIAGDLNNFVFKQVNLPPETNVGASIGGLNGLLLPLNNIATYSNADVIDPVSSRVLARVFTDYLAETSHVRDNPITDTPEILVARWLDVLHSEFSLRYSESSPIPDVLKARIFQFMRENEIGTNLNGKLNTGLKVSGDMLLEAMTGSLRSLISRTTFEDPRFSATWRVGDIKEIITNIRETPELAFNDGAPPSWVRSLGPDLDVAATHVNFMTYGKANLPEASLLKQESLARLLIEYQLDVDGIRVLEGQENRRNVIARLQETLSSQALPADLVIKLQTFAEQGEITLTRNTDGSQRLNNNYEISLDVFAEALSAVFKARGFLNEQELQYLTGAATAKQKLIDLGLTSQAVDSSSSQRVTAENQLVLDTIAKIGSSARQVLEKNVPLQKATTVTADIAVQRDTVSQVYALENSIEGPVARPQEELGLDLAKLLVKVVNDNRRINNPLEKTTTAVILQEIERVLLEPSARRDGSLETLRNQITEFATAHNLKLDAQGRLVSINDGSRSIYISTDTLAAGIHSELVRLGQYIGIGGVRTEPGVLAAVNVISSNLHQILPVEALPLPVDDFFGTPLGADVDPANIQPPLEAGLTVADRVRVGLVARAVQGEQGVQGNELEIADAPAPPEGERVATANLQEGQPLAIVRAETPVQKFSRLSLAGQGFAQLGFALFASVVGIAAGIAGLIYAAQSKTLSSSAKTLVITMNVVRVFSSAVILVGAGAQIASSVIKAVSIAADVTKIAEASFALGNVIGIATSTVQFAEQVRDISHTTATGRSLLIQRLAIVDTTIQLLLAIAGTVTLLLGPVGIAISVIILIVATLIPSTAAITTAITYHESYTKLKSQGLYQEAQVMFSYYQAATLDATPIVNWTSSIYTAEMKKAQQRVMDYAWMDKSAEERLFYSITSNTILSANFDGIRDQMYVAASSLKQPLVNLSQGLTRAVTLMLSQDNLSYFEGEKVATVKLAATSNYLTNTVVRTPKLISAVVNTQTLTLTFNQNLTQLASQLPDLSSFQVKVNGVLATVRSFSLSGNTVNLTLATAVTLGQVVTFSYTDRTGDNDIKALQNLLGNDVASIVDHAVVNRLDTDTRVPQLVDAVVQDRYLTLVFDEALDSTSGKTPIMSEFSVTVGGVISPLLGVDVGDNRVLLSLVYPVTVGAAVSVTYTPNASDQVLQDARGNKVLGFTSGSGSTLGVENTTKTSSISASRVGWLQYDNFVANTLGTGTEASSVLNGNDYTVYANEAAAKVGTSRLRYLSLSNAAGEFDMYAISRATGNNDRIWLDGSTALGTTSFSINTQDMVVWGGQGYNAYSLLRQYANSSIIVASNSWSNESNIVTLTGTSSDTNKTINLDYLLTADNISAGLPTGQTKFRVMGSNDGLDNVIGSGDNQSYFATTNVANINLTGANANVLVGEAAQVSVGTNGRVLVDMDMWRGLNLSQSTTTGLIKGDYGRYSLLNFAATDTNNPNFLGGLGMTYQLGHLPALSAFEVEAGGTKIAVTKMSISGNTITLNLASAVQQNQAVSLSYRDETAADDADTLQDLAGNDVGSFSGQVVNNFTADTTAPTLRVATVQGSTLIVRFSEVLQQAYKPLSSAFTVNVGDTLVAVSKVVFESSSSLRLTLASAVTMGQTVNIAYNATSDSILALQDLAGNTAASFSGVSVINLANVSTAPSLRSVTANGNVLTLNFDGTLRYTLSDASAFLVTADNTPVAISSVSVVGTSVILYLSSAVTSGQSVEVSYTAPQQVSDATSLRDWLGNGVGNLSAQLATNITGQDLTAPTLQYAIVNGNSLVLTFSEALNSQAGFTPLPNAFAVRVASSTVLVTQVAVSGSTVTLSLATAVDYAAAVSLSYTDLSSGNDVAVAQDLAGNDVASFSNINVLNNTPDTTAPTLLSATVTDNKLTLLFSETLNSNSSYLPALTSMSVNVAGSVANISSGSISGSTVTLTLTNSVNAGDYVTFNYTDPSSANDTQAFQDLAGNDVATIVSFNVSNLTGLDLTPPSIVSATVSSNVVTLTFSEMLASTALFTPASTAFSVYVDDALATVSAVTLNGTQALLTLSSAVDSTKKVAVSYMQPESQPIQDGSGNFAASFTRQAVSNVTTDTSAPTLSSATIAGPLLTLTFNENLATDTDLIPSASEFMVSVDGKAIDISGVVATGKIVTITLSKAVTATQAVSVDYTPATTGTNKLQDASGNATVHFSQAVSNWSGLASLQNATINGTQLILTFNQELDAMSGHLPPVSAFAVQVAGVNSTVSQLAVNGYTLTLTLDSAVNYGQAVTVNYTDPSTANDVAALQNLAGMDVQTFSAPYTVHNLTPQVADLLAPNLTMATINGSTLTLTFSEVLDAGVGEWLVNYLPDGQYDAQGNPVVTSRLQASGFVNVLGSNGNDAIIINDQSNLALSRQLNYVQLGNGQGVKVNNYDTSGNLLLALGSSGQADVTLESGSSLQKLFTTKLVQSDADIAKYKANRDTVTLKSLSSLTAFLGGYEVIDATESTSSLVAEIGEGDHQIKLGGQTVNLQFDKVVSSTNITTHQIPSSWLDYQYFNFKGIDANKLWMGRESDGTVLFQARWTNDTSGSTDNLNVSYDGTVSNVVMEVGNVLATAATSQLRLDKLIEVMATPAFSSNLAAFQNAVTAADTSIKLYRITDIVAYSAQSSVTGAV